MHLPTLARSSADAALSHLVGTGRIARAIRAFDMRAANIDSSQTGIVKALRAIGATVCITSGVGKGYPDLTVGWRGRTYLLECKTGTDKLNALQREWHSKWAGHVAVVRTPREAQDAVIGGGENA